MIDSYAFTACQNLKTANLSYGLQQLKEFAFSRTAIEQLVIPESVTKIGNLAFSDCTSLKEMVFLGYPPTFGDLVFSRVEATIYYPVGIPEWENLPYMGKLTWETFTCATHTVVTIQAKAPTCTEDGCTEGSACGVCKQVFTAWQVLPKTGHQYGPWEKNNAPNPTDWIQKRTCSTCGDEDIIKPNYPDTNNSGNNSDQGSTKPVTPENSIQNQPDPIIPEPTASQSPTESTPVQETTESCTSATDASISATDPISADPADTPKGTGGTKNALIFVGIGIVLLGLSTSGIVFLKPRLTGKKKE